MASHLRKQIRDAAKTALTGLATTGANVFASRVYPLQTSELPGLLIDTGDETIETGSLGGANRHIERTLLLEVQAVLRADSGYDDTADQITKEVEQALAANNSLGGLVKYVQPRSIATELSDEGEQPTVRRTLAFDVLYYTALNAPDVAQ